MQFFRKQKNANYNFISSYSWFTPGITGITIIMILVIAGGIISNLAATLFTYLVGSEYIKYSELISYPLIFIPAMIYAKYKSFSNKLSGYPETPINTNNFGKLQFWIFPIAGISIISLNSTLDVLNILMPPIPNWLEEALNQVIKGNIIVNIILAVIFAPILEEWLCRGIILRGLLYHKSQYGEKPIKPIFAIIISALVFGVIHLNPWQAIPAFIVGCLLGYIYYKTGSIYLTMFMHAFNNAAILFLGNFSLINSADTWKEILPTPFYILFIICNLIVFLITIWSIKKYINTNIINNDLHAQ